MSDPRLERVARAICNNFPRSPNGCAALCMDRLGSIPKGGCRHAKEVHRKTAQAAIDVVDKIAAEEFAKEAEETMAETQFRIEGEQP